MRFQNRRCLLHYGAAYTVHFCDLWYDSVNIVTEEKHMQSKEERREVQRKYYEQNKKRMQEKQAEYNKENTTFIGLRFNNKSDWDVVAKIKSVDSKPAYIRALIRDDIKRTGFDPGPQPGSAAALPPVEPLNDPFAQALAEQNNA